MECLFPGSSSIPRRFDIATIELKPGATTTVAGITVTAWEVRHPSGAPSLALRLDLAGTTIAYTGDTAWTDALIDCAAGADLLIAEAYYRDKNIPYHLRQTDLQAHRYRLTAKRIVITHMSADMLDHPGTIAFQAAHDGLTLTL
jgi:ribonuclease BN (tRNA processing enzyme)